MSGVTGTLIPFEEKAKVKYEDAVERAKKNDPEAFYWLAYYFLNGDGVTKDSEVAGKFLQKAVDAENARACYLAGLYHEDNSIADEHFRTATFSDLLTPSERLEIEDPLKKAGIITEHACSLRLPDIIKKDLVPRLGKRYCCYTNEVATGYIIGLYSTAIKGGLTFATNDIARLKRTIAKCHERIAVETEARAKSAAALDLLSDASAKEDEVAKQKEDEERRRQSKEREYWATWPRTLGDEELVLLDTDFEKKFHCAFLEERPRPRLLRLGEKCSMHSRTNTWVHECGKSLIVFHGDFFQKIDPNGLIVAWGLSNNVTDLEELRWYEEEKEKRLVQLRSKWAKERGMSLEEAMQKYKVWQDQSRMSLPPHPNRMLNLDNRPRLNALTPNNLPLSGLEIARARRARLAAEAREAEEKRQGAEQMQKAREERESEKREREQAAEERKAQLEQLRQIQEELRRQREEKERLREEELRKNNYKK